MAAVIHFEKIDKSWYYSTGGFHVMFGGIFGIYSDPGRMPEIWNDVRFRIGVYLHHLWPRRFRDACSGAGDFFFFADFPRSEQVELLRASEAMLRDFVDDKVDPSLKMDATSRLRGIEYLSEFVQLAKQELAATEWAPRSELDAGAIAYFRKTDGRWYHANSEFGLMFSAIYGIYGNHGKMWKMREKLRRTIGDYLYQYWPERFRFPDVRRGDCYLAFDDFPWSEQVELLRASEAMLRDLIDDKLDPVFGLDAIGRRNMIEAVQEFIQLAEQDLDAPELDTDEGE